MLPISLISFDKDFLMKSVGEWAVAATLLSETGPAKQRSKAGSVMQSCFAWGSILGALVVMVVQPAFGWRAVFLVGVLTALIVLYIRRNVKLQNPEYPLARKAKKQSFRTAFLLSSLILS